MSNSQKTDNDQQQFWQMVLETFKSSNLTVRQFCKKEGLTEPAFYSWRKKLYKNIDKPKQEKQNPESSAFIQVAMPSEKPRSLELLLSSGNTLKIPHSIDSKTLTNVLSALSKVGLC